jgi:hypothetical protein
MKNLFLFIGLTGLILFSCKKDEPIFTEQEAVVVDLGASPIVCEQTTTVIQSNNVRYTCVNLPDSLENLRVTYNKTFVISYMLLSSKGCCNNLDALDGKCYPIDRIELLTCRYK